MKEINHIRLDALTDICTQHPNKRNQTDSLYTAVPRPSLSLTMALPCISALSTAHNAPLRLASLMLAPLRSSLRYHIHVYKAEKEEITGAKEDGQLDGLRDGTEE